jgi:arginyl-tRNA synthetase
MVSLRKKLTNIVKTAFEEFGYESQFGEVTFSDRPDLSQFQCNGAFACGKSIRTNPVQVAKMIVEKIPSKGVFKEISIAGAGFINFILEDSFIAKHVLEMSQDENLGITKTNKPQKILLDYGGPNVGKPLHIGHLRTAIIGESLKRMAKALGHEVIGDIHLGDWGLQMGMIIVELERQHQEWVYFDESFAGPYPEESPINYEDFESTYPIASKRAKEDPEIMEKSRRATKDLQMGRPGYLALWRHFVKVSSEALKKSYDNLFVHFDLWLGESDVQDLIPSMVESLKKGGYTYESDGALVIGVKKPEDDYEVPPFMVYKSDGSSLYSTTDLATILQRKKDFEPDSIWYVVDLRQSMHFLQVFRCAYKTGIVDGKTELLYLGFGTMNGKDGKPYKTRDGGVMQLDDLIQMVEKTALERIEQEKIGVDYSEEEKKRISHYVGIAALKYGDLMNHRTKDYVFDMDRFLSFEGRTGAYLLYSIVRMKSILRKAKEQGLEKGTICEATDSIERDLQLKLSEFSDALNRGFEEKAPNNICDYVYNLAADFNRFYHEHRILTQENQDIQKSWLALLSYTHDVMEKCLDILGIRAPERL